jgi:hypothetical protein
VKPFVALLVLFSMWTHPSYIRVDWPDEDASTMLNPLSFGVQILTIHGEDICTIGWVPDDRLPSCCWGRR